MLATSPHSEIKTEGELQRAIADILGVLRAVDAGSLDARVELRYAETEPMAALAGTVNAIIQQLSRVREETQVYQRELETQLETIEKQRAAIKELSTPVIELWEGVLCLPLVGLMDTARSTDMTTALLDAVVQKNARCTIIDVTGIQVMDTRTVDHFIRMSKAVRLLGADCVLAGISPYIAQTVVHMGLDVDIVTYRTLGDALVNYVDHDL